METKTMYGDFKPIRSVCLNPACSWDYPYPEEIRAVLSISGYSQEEFGRRVKVTGRTVRRWIAGEKKIPYAAWCILCSQAGLGKIWQ